MSLNFRAAKGTPRSGEEKGRRELTEHLTDLRHRLEDHAGEADGHLDGFHVGELQQQRFVLGGVPQVSVRLPGKMVDFESFLSH